MSRSDQLLSLSDQEQRRILDLIATKHPDCLEPDGSGGLYKAVANLCRKASPSVVECHARIDAILEPKIPGCPTYT
jgi:hypothetical protein